MAKLLELFKQLVIVLVDFLSKVPPPKPFPEEPDPHPVPEPEPIPEPPKYDWSTPQKARHSVRVICDEEGLTLEQKNTLCATIGCESGWKNTAKLENKKDGKTWSTDWGICQINDYWHIGKGKTFPSVEYVLENPDKVVRWMCKMWKQQQRNLWVCYSKGLYKQYL